MMTPKYSISYRDDCGKRVFFTDSTGRGLFRETSDGRNPQLVGTSDAGPFATEAAFSIYVSGRFGG